MSAKYLLPCSCGRTIPVEAAEAGHIVKCVCGAELEIPAMRTLGSLERADPASKARRSSSVWGRREGWILVGAILAVMGLGPTVYLQVSRPRLENVHSLTPTETWALWQELRKGTDRHLTPEHRKLIEGLKANRIQTCMSLTLAGVGALLMTVFFLAPRQRSPQATSGRIWRRMAERSRRPGEVFCEH